MPNHPQKRTAKKATRGRPRRRVAKKATTPGPKTPRRRR